MTRCDTISKKKVFFSKVALVAAARLDLMASKQRLEEDIRVKKNSIAIDQVTVMVLILITIVTRTQLRTNPNQTIVYFVRAWKSS